MIPVCGQKSNTCQNYSQTKYLCLSNRTDNSLLLKFYILCANNYRVKLDRTLKNYKLYIVITYKIFDIFHLILYYLNYVNFSNRPNIQFRFKPVLSKNCVKDILIRTMLKSL